jgi:hypothetical protein
MRKLFAALAAIAAVLAASGSAVAQYQQQCQWVWDCSAGAGQCRQVPICNNTLAIPPPPPPQIPPIPPPSIRPIQPLGIPPIGTSQCQERYLCDNGQCGWVNVCQ